MSSSPTCSSSRCSTRSIPPAWASSFAGATRCATRTTSGTPTGPARSPTAPSSRRSSIDRLLRRRPSDVRDHEVLPTLLKGDVEQARQLVHDRLKSRYLAHRATIDEVVGIATDQNTRTERAASDFVAGRAMAVFLLGLIIMIVGSAASVLALRSVTRP